MKKKILFIVSLFALGFNFEVSAQCTPPVATGAPGLSPTWDSLPCIVRNENYSAVLELENFTTINTGSVTVTIQSLRVDSIGTNPVALTGAYYYNGVPSGITYTTNKGNAPVTFAGGETGCVAISGTTSAPVGNYRLGIWVTVVAPPIAPNPGISNEAGAIVAALAPTSGYNFVYYLRVVDSLAQCPADSSLAYVGVSEISSATIKGVTIVPNPFTNVAKVNFTSKEAGIYTGILYDVVGKEVKREELNVVAGSNSFNLDRGNLNKGAYLYTISNGKESISTRLVIRD